MGRSAKPVQIIGGGLAGLGLGIGLRLAGVPVTVWESGRYPRHRVCGEVLSGRGCDVLDRLEVGEKAKQAGARPAHTSVFYTESRATPVRPLPRPALCLSRYELDTLLAKHFRELGGDLREGQRCFESGHSEGFVRASGRPAQPQEGGWRWFGLKAHFKDVDLTADVEMHIFDSCYIGLCRLADGWVNVCGLFRRATAQGQIVHSRAELLRGPRGSALRERLNRASWDEHSFCAVAGLPLRPRRASDDPAECRLGDALTMISPVTGNGMSMALEAADLAVIPLTAYSRGQLDWAGARQQLASACDKRFARRLQVASWLHQSLFSRPMRLGLFWLGKSRRLSDLVFGLTR